MLHFHPPQINGGYIRTLWVLTEQFFSIPLREAFNLQRGVIFDPLQHVKIVSGQNLLVPIWANTLN
jgi:hypothetical protein